LVFAIDDWDQEASDWAAEHTPIFGSQDNARKASDDLLSILMAEVLVTALTTPSGADPQQWTIAKAKGLAVEFGAIGVTGLTTEGIKEGVGRDRPNDGDEKSFPSGHSSGAFATATLSNRNLDSINLPKGVCRTFQIGNLGLASAVAWARVEGKYHYPSDVLAGAALGHFLSAFIYNAFMNPPENSPINMAITPLDGGGALSVAFRF
jgi:membrane-associated phospholipid phosphatase